MMGSEDIDAQFERGWSKLRRQIKNRETKGVIDKIGHYLFSDEPFQSEMNKHIAKYFYVLGLLHGGRGMK